MAPQFGTDMMVVLISLMDRYSSGPVPMNQNGKDR